MKLTKENSKDMSPEEFRMAYKNNYDRMAPIRITGYVICGLSVLAAIVLFFTFLILFDFLFLGIALLCVVPLIIGLIFVFSGGDDPYRYDRCPNCWMLVTNPKEENETKTWTETKEHEGTGSKTYSGTVDGESVSVSVDVPYYYETQVEYTKNTKTLFCPHCGAVVQTTSKITKKKLN